MQQFKQCAFCPEKENVSSVAQEGGLEVSATNKASALQWDDRKKYIEGIIEIDQALLIVFLRSAILIAHAMPTLHVVLIYISLMAKDSQHFNIFSIFISFRTDH